MDLYVILGNLRWIDSVAAGVWIVLSGILIYTLVKAKKLPIHKRDTFSLGILLLISIYAYPIYTALIGGLEIALLGNLLTFFLTVLYSKSLKKAMGRLHPLMYPQITWIFIASIYVFLQAVAG